MNSIFNYLNLGVDFVDSGRFFRDPFKWLYYLIGVANFAIPVMMIYNLCESAKYMPGKFIFMYILLSLFALAIAFVACYWWYKRGSSLDVDARQGARFIAIPMISNFTQTAGEVLGIWVGIYGFIVILISLLFGMSDGMYELGHYGVWGLIIMPIAGYLIVLASRFLAELYLAIASIANSTKSIEEKIK